MWTLDPPMTAKREDEALTSIVSKSPFAVHAVAWQNAYDTYRAHGGDPWVVTATPFTPSIKNEQLALYENRKSGGPLNRIRQTTGIICCPMCGSASTGSLDHYLPKDDYPEFSVLPCNLVPACALCNSGAKGTTFRGSASPERFLHPYFDKVGGAEVWQTTVIPPYEAPTFGAAAASSLDPALKPLVDFHLANVFGPAFPTHMATYWSTLPTAIAAHVVDFGFDLAVAWSTERRWSERSFGLNGWRTALIRGVMADKAARAHVEALVA